MKKLLTVLFTVLVLITLCGCAKNEDNDGKTELELVTSLDQAILTLSTGKCDAVALDGTTAQNYVNQSDGQFAMSGVNFDLSIYGEFEGNVAAAKKGEKTLIEAVNACISKAVEMKYYPLWAAIAKIQAGTEDENALAIVGDNPIYNGIPIDVENYDYLVDTTDLEKPVLDFSNADGVLKNILNKGVMVIGTSPDYPEAEFIDPEDGTVYGCEMMLAKYVADCLGVKLKIETMDFSAVLTAVDTGKVDIGFSGFGYMAERAENFELSIGYVGDDTVNFHTLIVPADQADQYNSLADFVGKHIVAQASSLQQMYVEDQIIALEN